MREKVHAHPKQAMPLGNTARVIEEIDAQGNLDPARGKAVLAVFNWSQKAADGWIDRHAGER